MTDRLPLFIPLETRSCLPGTLYRFSVLVPAEHTDFAVGERLVMGAKHAAAFDVRRITLRKYHRGELKGRSRISVWLRTYKPVLMVGSVRVLIIPPQPEPVE